jgi:hypothetical protein
MNRRSDQNQWRWRFELPRKHISLPGQRLLPGFEPTPPQGTSAIAAKDGGTLETAASNHRCDGSAPTIADLNEDS